jgi:hypothetical protein
MTISRIKSENFNEIFDDSNGLCITWGKTKDDNPVMNEFGPSLLDVELSTICHGPAGVPCSFCYKSNNEHGYTMTLSTLNKILSKLPRTTHQIAYGIGDIYPELWDALKLTRSYGIVPNLTVNGANMTDDNVKNLASLVGACAISHYSNDICFDAVKKLTDAGLKQTNIHKILSEQTIQSCFDLVDSAENDPRLTKLNAIVFLAVKPKGKRNTLTPLRDLGMYKKLMDYAREKKIGFGFDSCSAPSVLKSTDEKYHTYVENCESTLFSGYFSVANEGNDAEFFPCSFTQGTTSSGDWTHGIKISEVNNFHDDIWYNPKVVAWRNKLLGSSSNCECANSNSCRSCIVYDITPCNEKNNLSLVNIDGV